MRSLVTEEEEDRTAGRWDIVGPEGEGFQSADPERGQGQEMGQQH